MYGAASDVRITCGALAPGPSFIPVRICSAKTSSGRSTADLPAAGGGLRDHDVEHRARRVPLGERAHGLGAVAVAGPVLGALAEVPALVLERVDELVREGGFGLFVAEVARHVHRPVGGLVVAGELVLQEPVLRRLVVELRRDESEELERQPLVRGWPPAGARA